MPDAAQTALCQHKLTLMGRLHDAQDDHNAAVLAVRRGVAGAALDGDILMWHALGSAIADLARLFCAYCAASSFCDARPGVEPLTARLVEAVDDQIDRHAWGVIQAQARLRAAQSDG